MSHFDISYKGDDDGGRRAICDLLRWFGLRKSKIIIREMQYARRMMSFERFDEQEMIMFLNGACLAIEIGGVSGEPIRRLFAHYLGEEMLRKWMDS